MKNFTALILALLSLPAFAGAGKNNLDIALGTDGKVDSHFPAGDTTPTYVALDLDIGTGLATAGLGAIQCGTTGTDFTHDIRQYLIAGTNAATATFSFNFVSGDNFITQGGAMPVGAANDMTFECASPTLGKSGVFTISVTDGTSTDISTNKSWAQLAAGAPPTGGDHTGTKVQFGFESGAILPRETTTSAGAYKDAALIQNLQIRETFTITSISNGNPAHITFTGTPVLTNENLTGNYHVAGGAGFRIGNASGMNEVDNIFVRCDPATITPSIGSPSACDLKTDSNADMSSDGNETLADHDLNSTSFGVFTGTVTATTFISNTTTASNNLGTGTNNDLKVVCGNLTPPDTLAGSADPFSPREGNCFMSTVISKTEDYAAMGGQGAHNKPRYTFLLDNSASGGAGTTSVGGTDIPYNTEYCVGASIALPKNYDHNDIGGTNNTENQYLRMAQADAQDEAPWTWGIEGNSSLTDHFFFKLDWGTHALDGSSAHEIDLGPVTNGINKWNDVLIHGKTHITNGFIEVWMREVDRTGLGTPGVWALKYSRGPGVGVGSQNPVGGGDTEADDRLGIRNYKHNWLKTIGTTPSAKIWSGLDAIYLARFGDGADCSNVTVDGSDPTLL